MASQEEVMEALSGVIDPEMKLSVTDLGLIYSVKIDDSHAEIDMTLTSPGCPMAPEIMAAAHRAALTAEGVESVHINLVWSPRWDPKKHASEDALMDMGIF